MRWRASVYASSSRGTTIRSKDSSALSDTDASTRASDLTTTRLGPRLEYSPGAGMRQCGDAGMRNGLRKLLPPEAVLTASPHPLLQDTGHIVELRIRRRGKHHDGARHRRAVYAAIVLVGACRRKRHRVAAGTREDSAAGEGRRPGGADAVRQVAGPGPGHRRARGDGVHGGIR